MGFEAIRGESVGLIEIAGMLLQSECRFDFMIGDSPCCGRAWLMGAARNGFPGSPPRGLLTYLPVGSPKPGLSSSGLHELLLSDLKTPVFLTSLVALIRAASMLERG